VEPANLLISLVIVGVLRIAPYATAVTRAKEANLMDKKGFEELILSSFENFCSVLESTEYGKYVGETGCKEIEDRILGYLDIDTLKYEIYSELSEEVDLSNLPDSLKEKLKGFMSRSGVKGSLGNILLFS